MGAMRIPTWHIPFFELIEYLNSQIDGQNDLTRGMQKLVIADYFMDSSDASDGSKIIKGGNIYFRKQDNAATMDYHQRFSLHQLSQTGYQKNEIQFMNYLEELKRKYKIAILKQNSKTGYSVIDSIKLMLINQNSGFTEAKLDKNVQKNLKKARFTTLQQYLTQKSDSLMTFQEAQDYEDFFLSSNYLHHTLFETMVDELHFTANHQEAELLWGRKSTQFPGLSQYKLIKGGMSQVTNLIKELIDRNAHTKNEKAIQKIQENTKVLKIMQSKDNIQVVVEKENKQQETKTFQKLIVTIPPFKNCNIELEGQQNSPSQREINFSRLFRLLSNEGLFKLALQFDYRFWEDSELLRENFAVIGGKIQTDLPSRTFVFPSYGYENGPHQKGSILIYSQTDDAYRHSRSSDSENIERALNDLNIVYNRLVAKGRQLDVKNYFNGKYFIQRWATNEHGGVAMFKPAQQELQDDIKKGFGGNIFFAGEYMSLHHGWIAGSMESAVTAVKQVLCNNEITYLSNSKGVCCANKFVSRAMFEDMKQETPLTN
ncbi:amine oxidase [Stylonychia lemnae]|uniref:Amine oxidase n=1 Tax=Stylonychia lemnae TaxID=5949 RepID=A0A078AGJ5_STYLE|nr:amine oxidase [Stylonychia lemnae]|eukprot:CDW81395.1 amine oxidase [Stylonychia lemnae]